MTEALKELCLLIALLSSQVARAQTNTITDWDVRRVVRQLVKEKDEPLIAAMKDTYVAPVLKDSMADQFLPIFHRLQRGTSFKIERVVILPVPEPNALALPDSAVVFTTGLLERAQDENDMAFVVAHEMAHHILGHTSTLTKTPFQRSDWKQPKIGHDYAEQTKRIIYDARQYQRSREVVADEIAVHLLQDQEYGRTAILRGLDLLDPTARADIDEDYLIKIFGAEGYPFQSTWLRDRLTVHERKPNLLFDMDLDSLLSHPKLEGRKEMVQDMLGPYQHEDSIASSKLIDHPYDMTNIIGSYILKRYDQSMYLALSKLKKADSRRDDAIAIITQILIRFYQIKDWGEVRQYIQTWTYEYSREERLVNTFLWNIRKDEIYQVAYHFLMDESRYNDENEHHMYLRWRLCALMYRNDEANAAKRRYRKLFPKGIYRRKMRTPYY